MARRTLGDFILLWVTAAELVLLFYLTPTFDIPDWIYVLQHFLVFSIAISRAAPIARDHSLRSSIAVAVSYTYAYAQVAYLRWVPGESVWPRGGFVLIVIAALLSLASLLTLRRRFGVRPALRGLATGGPYRLVRHPMYLAYVLADIGYNLDEGNVGTVLLVLAGWASLVYRIRAEERILARDDGWKGYSASVRSRLIPGVW
jgi:protein-S-isoprenylcysteine O-methyltransferase Ste14